MATFISLCSGMVSLPDTRDVYLSILELDTLTLLPMGQGTLFHTTSYHTRASLKIILIPVESRTELRSAGCFFNPIFSVYSTCLCLRFALGPRGFMFGPRGFLVTNMLV